MFRKFAVPLALLITLGTSGMLGAFAQEAPDRDDYLIRNTKTGRYLVMANNDLTAGNAVVEYTQDGLGANRFVMTKTEDGQTVFSLVHGEGLVLTVNSEGMLTVEQYENGNAFQQFSVEGEGKHVKLSAGGWMLSPDESTADGAFVHMNTENERSEWELVPVSYNQNAVGDVNRDGVVDVFDLVLAKRLLLSDVRTDAEQVAITNVDMQNGNQLDVADIIRLTKYLHGIEPQLSSTQSEHIDGWHFIGNTIFPMVDFEVRPTDPVPPTYEPTYEPTTEPTDVVEPTTEPTEAPTEAPTTPGEQLTLADVPAEYAEALDWIWQNRFVYEGSTTRQNTIFDQIVAGKGTLNFVVRWQSYKQVTYEQRQQFAQLASDSVNAWNDYLRGYDGWPYDHIEVNVVGWAVLDKSCLLDLHDDEIVYDNLIEPYDSQWDTSNGYETIPDKLPSAPSELSRFDHFFDKSYEYPGGLDKRFDMYLWATQGFPAIGGSGGDWGQRLSDDAYLNMLGGSNIHVLTHEIGHGFGITDFYGANGNNDGPPPNGFPDNGTSIMMAGSSTEITPFDGWMLRCIWSHIKDEDGRFTY